MSSRFTSSRFLVAAGAAVLLLLLIVWSVLFRPHGHEKALASALLNLHQKSFPTDPALAGSEVTLTPDQANIPRTLLPNHPISFLLTKDKAALLFDEHRFMGVEVIRTYVLNRSELDPATWHLSYYSGGWMARRKIVTVKEGKIEH